MSDVADRLGVAPSTVSRIETGKAPTRSCFLRTMLDAYGVDDPDLRRQLADLAREGQRRGWWADYADVLSVATRTYLGLEGDASQVGGFAAQLVPDLLQTREYAAAACRAIRPELSPGEVRRVVEVVMRRQQLLAAGTVGLHLVIDEAVLLRSVGSEPVMAGQLEHLLSKAALPFVTLQVAGLSEAHLRLSQSFTVLRFAHEADAAACFDAGAGRVSLINHAAEVDAVQDTFAVLARTAMSPDNSAVLLEEMVNGRCAVTSRRG